MTDMDFNMLEDLKELVAKDICEITKLNNIPEDRYAVLGEAVDIFKDIQTIEAMDAYQETDYEVSANAMPRRYDNRMNDTSYMRGRDARTGRYVSRTPARETKMYTLDDMMAHAQTEQERQMVQRMMNEM